MVYNPPGSPLNYPLNSPNAIRIFKYGRKPTTSDFANFIIRDFWIDTSLDNLWFLVDKSINTATWILLGGTSAVIDSLTGDTGGPVFPDADDNINVLGGSNIGTSGSGSTLTVNLDTNIDVTSLTTGIINSGSGVDLDITLGDDAGANNLTIFNSGPTEIFNLNSLGYLNLPLQPMLLASIDANVPNVTGDATTYTVLFDVELFDITNNYNPATGIFTAPVTGKYLFNWNIGFGGMGAAHTSFTHTLLTSNRNYQGCSGNPYNQMNVSTNAFNVPGTIITDMDVTDTAYVTMRVQGGTKTVSNNGDAVNNATRLSIMLLG